MTPPLGHYPDVIGQADERVSALPGFFEDHWERRGLQHSASLEFTLPVAREHVFGRPERGNLFLSHQARKRSSGAGSGSAESLRRLSGYTEYFPKAIADFAQAPLIEPDNVEIHREMEDLIRCTARN